ncbi:MAG: M16 family metallopeptidase [Oscillospiraceae bacterium]
MLNTLTDKRFKVNQFTAVLFTEISEATLAELCLVPDILVDSCEKYPDYLSLNRYTESLYNLSLSTSIDCCGGCRATLIRAVNIDDRYALNGEKLERATVDLLIECLFRPRLENGAFAEEPFKIAQNQLIDDINAEKNDKSTYAARRGAAVAYRGEPSGLPYYGTMEQAVAATPQSAYAAYKEMLRTAHVEIFAVGCSEFAETAELFAKAFSSIERSDIVELKRTPSPLKTEVCETCETAEMEQAILRMYYKSEGKAERCASALACSILGGLPTSRFFTVIREKQSLCYYCASGINNINSVLSVSAGVEPKNLELTRAAVTAQLERMIDEGITEEELEQAKESFRQSAGAVYDSVSSITSWYLGALFYDEIYSPEEVLMKYEQCTVQDVIDALKTFKLDTVYVLKPEEEK